ncbi:MAG: methionyl-tRNA formyltransferase [Sedimentisphaerales bacterium]|nr:methionyl-tRNA formyltransferase [Sedimentisphaerales bacterium]
MNIVFIGSGEFGIPCLDAVLESKHSIEFVVTQPPRAAGRGRKTTPTAVASWAKEHAISFIETDNNANPSVISKVADTKPDLILMIAFGQKICNELINLSPKGMINVHGSLLPKYRGAAPINWAVINGENKTGATILTVTEKWDAGKILATVETPVGLLDTAGDIRDRVAALAAPVLIDTIDKIESGSAVYVEQDHSAATLAPKLKKSNGFIDFNAPAMQVHNKIRGLWPWPGASADFQCKKSAKTKRVTFALTEPVESPKKSLTNGTLDDIMNVTCETGALKILKIKPAGGSVMNFKDFVNGHRAQAGDFFLKINE